ncbi:MAG: hypothetical protein H0U52_07180 [Chloroflexi bacterium]|nr:hypothetical protein [Chloroflexota bacterium]
MLSIRRLTATLGVAVLMLGAMAPATLAGGATNQQAAESAGWGCGADVGLPAGHCINAGTIKSWSDIVARGGTFQLRVFDASGNFLAAEIASFKPSSDGRACPIDPKSTDGTYWEFVPGLWVCHHQPA